MPKKGSLEPASQVATEDTGGRPPFSGGDLGIHLLVCVLVGGGLGYALDRWLGWAPWGMIAGGFLGFGAWLRAVWKVLGGR
jgi:ATP synthase protein I